MPGSISPDALNRLVRQGRETSFLIVDVRAESTYALDHIPGAVNLPASGIATHSFDPETWDTLIFYCRNGVRSKAAACIAEENGFPGHRIFNLSGGMAAYSGEILLDAPVVFTFPDRMSPAALLKTAVNLEKGASLFYRHITPRFSRTPVHPCLSGMAVTEEAHARIVYDALAPLAGERRSFEVMFHSCPGDIVEGGKPMAAHLKAVEQAGNSRPEAILELALEMEYAAYDLYKNRAAAHAGTGRAVFADLAQAEKSHIADILACIDFMTNS